MNPTREQGGASLSLFETAALTDALLGLDLPTEVEMELRLAGLAYQSDEEAERHLFRARALAPDHPAVLIGFYRFYFYNNRLEEALVVARICLLKAARDNALNPYWRRVAVEDADFGSYDAVLPRFYLFTLKAYAYLQLRLGHMEEGRDAALKTVALDPTDKIGVKVLLEVLERSGVSDDD